MIRRTALCHLLVCLAARSLADDGRDLVTVATVTVKGSDGSNVAGAELKVRDPATRAILSRAVTTGDGATVLRAPRGRLSGREDAFAEVVVEVTHRDHAYQAVMATFGASVTVSLRARRVVRGTVVDSEGRALRGISVLVAGASGYIRALCVKISETPLHE